MDKVIWANFVLELIEVFNLAKSKVTIPHKEIDSFEEKYRLNIDCEILESVLNVLYDMDADKDDFAEFYSFILGRPTKAELEKYLYTPFSKNGRI